MKALGATDWFLYRIVLKHSLISLFIGTVIGLVLGVFANNVINQSVPGMTARLDGSIIMQTVLAGLVMAILSTGLPMWRLSRLDPMEAFRS
jgi:putative ABC transport system permease protein